MANIVLTMFPFVTKATVTAGLWTAVAAVWIKRAYRLTGATILALKTQAGINKIFTVISCAVWGAGTVVVVAIVDRCAVSRATSVPADVKLLRTVFATVS